MDIALIGYGKMGRAIHDAALTRNHKIISKITAKKPINQDLLKEAVCIDFTNSQAFHNNYKVIADNCKAAVVGTTGWENIKEEVIDYFKKSNKTLIYASNFSIGANILFQLTKTASKLLAGFKGYDPYLIDMHHKEKKDRPSGTAKTLATILEEAFDQKIDTASIRSGWIRGVHEVGFESMKDKISIKHEAYSRDIFADGAILAAEWTREISGIWEFQDLLKTKFAEILK